MGIDPITHKPLSQMLFDYGSISSLPTIPKPLIGPFNKTSTPTPTMAKTQQPFSSGTNLGQQFQFQTPKKPHIFNEQPTTSSCSSSSINGGETVFHLAASSKQSNGIEPFSQRSEGSSSDSSFDSFVDALLEQDFEIKCSFPEILDGCFDY